jgi:periplasmic protein TonB
MRYRIVPAALIAVACAQPALARHHARPPQPAEDPASWLGAMDYPPAAMRMGEQGDVAVTLAVDAQGRVTGCRIDQSSGFPDLDTGTCQRLSRRAHFQPAADAQGQPAAGVYSHTVHWRQPG